MLWRGDAGFRVSCPEAILPPRRYHDFIHPTLLNTFDTSIMMFQGKGAMWRINGMRLTAVGAAATTIMEPSRFRRIFRG
jgi:hypothetical protein